MVVFVDIYYLCMDLKNGWWSASSAVIRLEGRKLSILRSRSMKFLRSSTIENKESRLARG